MEQHYNGLGGFCRRLHGVHPSFFHTSTEFIRFELWKYPVAGFDAQYIATANVTVVGLSAVATSPAHQMTLTFRSAAGGVMRLQFMETVYVLNNKNTFPTGITVIDALATYTIGSTSVIQARDDSRPVASLRASFGQNEKLFRKRFRTT